MNQGSTARVWTCMASPEGATRYVAYFRGTLLPELETLAGFMGATVMTRDASDTDQMNVHIVVTTEWVDSAAIAGFAGDDITRAVIEPEALALLTHADNRVLHYTVHLGTKRT